MTHEASRFIWLLGALEFCRCPVGPVGDPSWETVSFESNFSDVHFVQDDFPTGNYIITYYI